MNEFECSVCKRTDIGLIKSKGICSNCNKRLSKKHCKETNCSNKAQSQGYCDSHYVKAMEAGLIQKRTFNHICTVRNCGKKHLARGFCNFHYKRLAQGLDPHIASEVTVKKPVSAKWEKAKRKIESEKATLREAFLKNPIRILDENIMAYRFDVETLLVTSQLNPSVFAILLENLKEDERILDFFYDKKLMVVEIHISKSEELDFLVNLNQKPDGVLI